VINGVGRYTSATREPRANRYSRRRTGHRMGGDLSNHPASGASRPGRCAAAVGNDTTLVCTGVGVESLGGGGRATNGCHAASPARFRGPPPDSGVVPFSGKPSPPIKSGSSFPGRVGFPFGAGVPAPSNSPVKPWGENENRSDRAYGISCLTRTNSHFATHGGQRMRTGIARASWRTNPVHRSLDERCLPRRTSCPTAATDRRT